MDGDNRSPAAAGVLEVMAAVPQMGRDGGEARRSENSKLKQEEFRAKVLGPATEEAAPGVETVGGVATTFLLQSQKQASQQLPPTLLYLLLIPSSPCPLREIPRKAGRLSIPPSPGLKDPAIRAPLACQWAKIPQAERKGETNPQQRGSKM